MFKRVIWLSLLTIFYSCDNNEIEIRNYYNGLLQINNELLLEIYETLYETRKCFASADSTPENDSSAYVLIRHRLENISSLCSKNLERLEELGPLRGDSLLYKTFLQSFSQLGDLSKNEFNLILDCIHTGEMSKKRVEALYAASLKLADNHIAVLDSLSKFNQKYETDLHTIEIEYHRKKTEKFKKDIFRITRSVCVGGNCLNGFGQQQDENGTLYSGYFNNGLFHGKGKLVYSSGNTYEGEFFKGSFQGYGTYNWNTGKKYVGEWRDDDMNGIGTLYTEHGDTIFGYWQNGEIKKFN